MTEAVFAPNLAKAFVACSTAKDPKLQLQGRLLSHVQSMDLLVSDLDFAEIHGLSKTKSKRWTTAISECSELLCFLLR